MNRNYHEAKERQHFTSTHQGLANVWREVKAGHLDMLAGRSKFLGRAIIDHPQYQPFLEVPLVFGTEADEAKVREAMLHLTTDSEVLQQISSGDPTETGEAYRGLMAVGVEDHEARHTISRVMAEVIWQVNQGRKLDPDYLVRKLGRLASSPLKVLREQERQSRRRR